MTESDVLSLNDGDRFHTGDGVVRTVKGTPSFRKGWFGKIKSITFLVSFDNGWNDLVTGYEVGNPQVIKDWKFV